MNDAPRWPSGRAVIVVAAVVLVLALLAIAAYAWQTLGASEMTVHGYVALALGVIGTAGLGIGLMVLVFYSHRYGYDERVGGRDEPLDRR
jgi:uncharacterized membrane protein